MKINPEVEKQLDLTFPEKLQQRSRLSEIEKKVENYVNHFLLKGCQWWEIAAQKVNTAKNIYKAAWIPYYMLKHPLAYRKLLHDSSAEKNLQILADATAQNITRSVVSPRIYRKVPWMSISPETREGITKFLSVNSLLYPFVYSPAYDTYTCIKDSSVFSTLDIKQILAQTGSCLNKSSKIYQPPEAIVGVVTSLALGLLFGIASYSFLYLFLSDSDKKERYENSDKIYTDVVMLLKSRWDDAAKNNDTKAMEECVAQATKLSTNSELISEKLTSEASLTTTQTNDIKLKLSWGFNYVLNHNKQLNEDKLIKENTKAVPETK